MAERRIVINTTFYVAIGRKDEFLAWVRRHYIPCARQARLCDLKLMRLLIEVQEGMQGYAVAVTAPGMAEATEWHDGPAALLRDQLSAKFGEEALYFTTYMEECLEELEI